LLEVPRLKLLGLLLAAMFVLGACGGEAGDTGEGEEPADGEAPAEGDLSGLELNIGTVLPLTGDLAQFGPAMENGAKLAAQQLNECGTMTINMIHEDDGTNEQTAATAADKLINTDNVSVIVGAAASRVSFAVLDTAAVNEVVQISPASTSPDFTDYEDNGYFFRTTPSDAFQGVILAQIAQDAGYETVNVLALNDDYGQGIARVFEESFTEAGGEVAANVAYDPAGTQFSSEVQQAASGDPDAILLVAFPETGAAIMQAAIQQGLVGEVPFLFTDGLADPEFPEAVGDSLDGERGTRPAAEGPGIDDFNAAYQEEFDGQPGTFSANTYDAVMLAALAAAAAGSTEGPDIRDNLQDVSREGAEILPADICEGLERAAAGEDINYEGAAGSQDFDENGDVTSDYELWEFQGGEVVRVELISPPESG
jgi:ABC-type branched-subunit amino acid transport system substrate-binding protein